MSFNKVLKQGIMFHTIRTNSTQKDCVALACLGKGGSMGLQDQPILEGFFLFYTHVKGSKGAGQIPQATQGHTLMLRGS